MAKREDPVVQVGEIYQDCDWRQKGRRVKVRAIIDTAGTGPRKGQTELLAICDRILEGNREITFGAPVHIRVRRMYKHSTGWAPVRCNGHFYLGALPFPCEAVLGHPGDCGLKITPRPT